MLPVSRIDEPEAVRVSTSETHPFAAIRLIPQSAEQYRHRFRAISKYRMRSAARTNAQYGQQRLPTPILLQQLSGDPRYMKQRLLLLAVLLCNLAAFAQFQTPTPPPPQLPKWDVYFGYGLTRVGSSNLTSGFYANGGLVQLQWHFGKSLSVVADAGANTKSNAHGQKIDQTLYTFVGGPRYSFHVRKGAQIVYVQGLFGETHGQSWISVPGTIPVAKYSNSQWAFSTLIAGGTELRLSPRIWFRPAEIGYFMTTFPAVPIPGLGVWNSSGRQNDFRYSAGMRFAF